MTKLRAIKHRDDQRLRALPELATLHRELQDRERERVAHAERDRAAAAAAERAKRLFADSVGRVTALAPHGRAAHAPSPPAPLPRQREADERAALREAWSDDVDVASLLLTDDGLSFHRPGIDPGVVARLRRGQWAIQGELDLHGLRRDAARDAVAGFVRNAARRGWRCVRVVHGKGHGSPGREPVLKGKVQRWLGQNHAVLAFAQASALHGGAGALVVLLRG